MPNIFLSVKGFGDMVVLANALHRVRNPKESEVLISGRLHDLAKTLLPEEVRISVIPNLQGALPLYNMRADWRSMFKGFGEIRRTVRKRIDSGGKLILDLPNIKNTILFSNIDHGYLPRSNNIYNSYALELGYGVSDQPPPLMHKSRVRNCVIFPFGSVPERSISEDSLLQLLNLLNNYKLDVKVVCHSSDLLRIPNKYKKSCISFQNSVELISQIKNAQLLITVDTVAMHLASHFNIATFVISDGWKFFIPPTILKLTRFYRKESLNLLIQDLEIFFSQQ